MKKNFFKKGREWNGSNIPRHSILYISDLSCTPCMRCYYNMLTNYGIVTCICTKCEFKHLFLQN